MVIIRVYSSETGFKRWRMGCVSLGGVWLLDTVTGRYCFRVHHVPRVREPACQSTTQNLQHLPPYNSSSNRSFCCSGEEQIVPKLFFNALQIETSCTESNAINFSYASNTQWLDSPDHLIPRNIEPNIFAAMARRRWTSSPGSVSTAGNIHPRLFSPPQLTKIKRTQ